MGKSIILTRSLHLKSLKGMVRLCCGKIPLWILILFPFFIISSALAGSSPGPIPAEYGEVICRFNDKSPNQLFIIGMSHRDALTRLNGSKIPRVQAEVYKLGEWLIRNEGVELLLPEGFFVTGAPRVEKEGLKKAQESPACGTPLDLATLENHLSDQKSFINAEMLLKRNYPLRLKQVEDKEVYMAVNASLRKLVDCSADSSEFFQVKADLDYLQEERTALMLQRIPEIINAEFREGNIKAKKGVFTIGLAHIPMIIKSLNEKKIRNYSPLTAANRNSDTKANLILQQEKFNIAIIIPRTLADDREALRMNKLDQFFSSSAASSFAGTSGSVVRVPAH
jgi:hypothetical protein